jgi:hypothetical protein
MIPFNKSRKIDKKSELFLFLNKHGNLYLLLMFFDLIVLTLHSRYVRGSAMGLKLNIKLVELEMERQGLSRKDLCKRLNLTRTSLYYIWGKRPISYADKFGNIFKRSPRDFIV